MRAQTDITLGTNSLTFGHGAGTGSLVVAGEWSASTDTPWLHISTSSGSSSTLFLFTYDANFGPTRSGTIEFNGTAATLTVTQAGVNYVPARELTTIASAGVDLPNAVAADSNGNLYIANGYVSGLVQKWTAATRQLTVLFGMEKAPAAIALDASGNVYCSNSNGVWKWTPAMGGGAIDWGRQPLIPGQVTGMAVDAAGDVYFSNANHAVMKYSAATGHVTTVVSGQSVGIIPATLALDQAGDLYLAAEPLGIWCSWCQVNLLKWTVETGQITTLLSLPYLPNSLAVDSVGNLYWGGGAHVQKWTASTGQITDLPRAGNIALDTSGHLYGADYINNAVWEWNVGTEQVTTLVSAGIQYPFALALDPRGNLYFGDLFTTSEIKKWATDTGQISSIVRGLGDAPPPMGIALDRAGNIYVAAANQIQYFANGCNPCNGPNPLITSFGSPAAVPIGGIALDANGDLYMTVTQAGNSGAVERWTPSTPPPFNYPYPPGQFATILSGIYSWNIARDVAGYLYIVDSTHLVSTPSGLVAAVDKIDPETGEVTALSSLLLAFPALATDGSGNVYFADGGTVKRWSPVTRQATAWASNHGAGAIFGLAVDSAGNDGYSSDFTPSVKRYTHSFVGPAAFVEPLTAGSDQLSPVLPTKIPLDAVGDQPWLTITSQDSGIVKFSFTAAMEPRTAHINLLGQSIPVTQTDENRLTPVFFRALWGSESYTLTGSTRNRLPWEITAIQVVFSQPILSADTASLTGVTATGLSGLGTNTLTWTINPVSVGSLTLALAESGPHAVRDSFGNTLRENESQTLRVLLGDFNDDGVVNAADLSGVNQARVNSYSVFADLNGDDVVDSIDVQIVRNQIGKSLP